MPAGRLPGAFGFELREKRAVAEPPTATVLKGPREGFIEEIKTNTALVRRRIKSPDLVFENLTVGRYSGTPVSLAYIHGVADPRTVDEIRRRLSEIDTDGVIDSSYLAAFLEPTPLSLFSPAYRIRRPLSTQFYRKLVKFILTLQISCDALGLFTGNL